MEITIHDCLVGIIGRKPSDDLVSFCLLYLPEDILVLSKQWGPDNTEVWEHTFRWLKDIIIDY